MEELLVSFTLALASAAEGAAALVIAFAILEAVAVIDESHDVAGPVILDYLARIRTGLGDRALV